MFKVNNKDIKTTPIDDTIVNFEHVIAGWGVLVSSSQVYTSWVFGNGVST